jgi:hypothetical protein
MRKLLKILCLSPVLLLLGNQKCDFGDPNKIEPQVSAAIRPYFPDAQVIIRPQEQIIIVATCVRGEGPKFVEQVADTVQTMPEMRKLQQLRAVGGLFGHSTYANFALGFENYFVVYDVEQGRTSYGPIPPEFSDWSNTYSQLCGFAVPSEPVSTTTPCQEAPRAELIGASIALRSGASVNSGPIGSSFDGPFTVLVRSDYPVSVGLFIDQKTRFVGQGVETWLTCDKQCWNRPNITKGNIVIKDARETAQAATNRIEVSVSGSCVDGCKTLWDTVPVYQKSNIR